MSIIFSSYTETLVLLIIITKYDMNMRKVNGSIETTTAMTISNAFYRRRVFVEAQKAQSMCVYE